MNVIDITPTVDLSKNTIRLAAYCRVSSDSEDQLHSFAAQIQYYKVYEQKNPQYKLVDIYADEGITGTSMKNRDELLRLLQDCKRGVIDRIIVKSVSRFARNTEELLVTLRMLKELGVSVFFEEQCLDTDKLNMEMIVTFPGMAAQQESESISGNMRWSYIKRMESGEFNCCTPAYGFDLVNGELLINETEAEVVRHIFTQYLQGYGLQAIANQLNADNTPRKYSKQIWSLHTIKYILSNERYIGDALLQKEYTTDTLPFKRKINHGEQTQYYVENANPAIISKDTFFKVQELLKQKKVSPNCRSKHFPLSKALRCPDCGQTFRRLLLHGTAYWICCEQASGKPHPTRRLVKEDSIYESFYAVLYKLSTFREPLLKRLLDNIDIMQSQTNLNHKRIAEIDVHIANLSAQHHILSKLHTRGILSEVDYVVQSSEINTKISTLRAERKIKLRDEEFADQFDQLREVYDAVENLPSETFDADLFCRVVDHVTVINNAELTFHLIGGIALSETIDERSRCKNT